MSDTKKKLFGLFRSRSSTEKAPRDPLQVRLQLDSYHHNNHF
jgi:hypothetical protein